MDPSRRRLFEVGGVLFEVFVLEELPHELLTRKSVASYSVTSAIRALVRGPIHSGGQVCGAEEFFFPECPPPLRTMSEMTRRKKSLILGSGGRPAHSKCSTEAGCPCSKHLLDRSRR